MRLYILQGNFDQCRNRSAALQPSLSRYKGDTPKAFLPVVLHQEYEQSSDKGTRERYHFIPQYRAPLPNPPYGDRRSQI